MKYRIKDEVVKKNILTPGGHNCFECQPYVKEERLFRGCLFGCRPDHTIRLGDDWHMQGCPNIGKNVAG